MRLIESIQPDKIMVNEVVCIRCNKNAFHLQRHKTEGVAKIKCTSCMNGFFLFDSGEHWYDVYEKNPPKIKCKQCKNDEFKIFAGLQYREIGGEISWVYIGSKCTNCEKEEIEVDWKIDYSPTNDLEKILFDEELYQKKEKLVFDLLLTDEDFHKATKFLNGLDLINGNNMRKFYYHVGMKGQVYMLQWSEDEAEENLRKLIEWIDVNLKKWGKKQSFASESLLN
ncbi:hypothetical protein SAMN02799624_04559 [Paenibacillus sp. UNC496MF]|uniref:hypothetical protein n=1 Tax=Paenibacillus sp. UNC496MF TaxID=1502753 RepID=UPI0008E1C0D2|nr:hypothetical protein [Paenibacillus sp. UNC496MF]SFJ44650.1 hypothetical protein SAMN02799624_04559 [Paenibacillus sp. UNC496MF]